MVPATHDVVDGEGKTTLGDNAATYQHVAKRRHGVVALAEGRGFPPDQAERAIDALADSFEQCATERQAEGKLVTGAVRVVARVDATGNVDGWTVRASPGPAVAANVLVCILAPLKAATFGPGGPRGLALESEWAPVSGASR